MKSIFEPHNNACSPWLKNIRRRLRWNDVRALIDPSSRIRPSSLLGYEFMFCPLSGEEVDAAFGPYGGG
jgi:hypothetical protein